MTRAVACIKARRYSDNTVATFYCGKEWKPEPKFEIEQTKMPTFWFQRKDCEYDGLHFMDDFGTLVRLDFLKIIWIL